MHFAFMGLYMALCMVELRPTHLGTDIGICPKSSNIKVASNMG